jgi:hypothetical protein
MEPTLVSWNHMIDGESCIAAAAILARIIVAPKDLAPGEFDMGSRSTHLEFKADDGRAWKHQSYRVQVAAAISYHGCLTPEYENHGPPRGADVDRLEVRVEDQNWLVHGAPAILRIIA